MSFIPCLTPMMKSFIMITTRMMTMTLNKTLTDAPGILVGHQIHLDGATGCTVIFYPLGTVGGVDQRGGAPGTRETHLLRPMHTVHEVNESFYPAEVPWTGDCRWCYALS